VAYERKAAGLDWQAAVLTRWLSGGPLEVARLRANKSFGREEERASAFVAAGHGCRATYFNYARRLRPTEIERSLKLRNSEPPAPPHAGPSSPHLQSGREDWDTIGF
jgi:hypothetical protein